MMAGIKGKDTRPEMLVRRYLHGRGLRFRLHDNRFPGKPDLVFPKYRTIVLVHGCFWHRHPNCRFATTPASNASFWGMKLSDNVTRDNYQIAALTAQGWRVVVVWECELKEPDGRLAALYGQIVGVDTR